jgi:hypothetical protein
MLCFLRCAWRAVRAFLRCTWRASRALLICANCGSGAARDFNFFLIIAKRCAFNRAFNRAFTAIIWTLANERHGDD